MRAAKCFFAVSGSFLNCTRSGRARVWLALAAYRADSVLCEDAYLSCPSQLAMTGLSFDLAKRLKDVIIHKIMFVSVPASAVPDTIFRCPPTAICYVLITTSSSVFLSTWPTHLSLASLVFSLMSVTPALALKVYDTNLIYPGIIGQQAFGFEVRVSENRYLLVQQQRRGAITDKQVNTGKQAHCWGVWKICAQNNQCHQ